MNEERKPVGYVIAKVRFPVYQEDDIPGPSFDWFEYRQPGIGVDSDKIGICIRKCETLEAEIVIEKVKEKKG